MGKKGVIAVSGVLLVAAIVGAVVCLVIIPRSRQSDDGGAVAVSTKTTDALCDATAYPDTCKNTLSSLTSSNSSTVISTAVKAALDAVQTAHKRSATMGESVTDPYMKMAFDDCRELLESAYEEIKAVMSVTSLEEALTNRSSDMRVWLSAVRTFQETCLDGLDLPELRKQMEEGLGNARELTSVALSLVTLLSSTAVSLPDALQGLGIGLGRRMLTDEGIPEWLMKTDEAERRFLTEEGIPDWLLEDKNGRNLTAESIHDWLEVDNKERILTEEGIPDWLQSGDGEKDKKKKKKKKSEKKEEKNSNTGSKIEEGWIKRDAADAKAHVDYKIDGRAKPNMVVAQDGSGDYTTINEAVKNIPLKNLQRFVVYVKAGRYHENVLLTATNVYMYGDGPKATIVTGNKHYPVRTFQTATFAVTGAGFVCKNMGFSNTAGPDAGQAVAVRNQADKSVFMHVRMDGHQDTLYAHADRQFYRNCLISGTIDFIFGNAAAVIQNSLIVVRQTKAGGSNMVTAQGSTDKHDPTGIVIHKCRIVADKALFPNRFKVPSYLGRPWKPYAKTVVMETKIGDLIRPEGWSEWEGSPENKNTLFYAEYANTGPGKDTSNRVDWPGYKVITDRQEALRWSTATFLETQSRWLGYSGVPVAGLRP